MGQSGSKCSITPFSTIFSFEKVFIVIVLGMMNIYEEHIKNEKF